MKCKTWCVDLEHNEVAQVYASQLKDRVLRFGLEHPGSQAEPLEGATLISEMQGCTVPKANMTMEKHTL